MSTFTDALEKDLTALIVKHSHVSGKEFQAAALNIAAGFFEADELDNYTLPTEAGEAFASALTKALAALPPIQ